MPPLKRGVIIISKDKHNAMIGRWRPHFARPSSSPQGRTCGGHLKNEVAVPPPARRLWTAAKIELLPCKFRAGNPGLQRALRAHCYNAYNYYDFSYTIRLSIAAIAVRELTSRLWIFPFLMRLP